VEPDVVITGWVDESDYWEWIRVADLVVQLREMSSGESSASVVDAMAMGRVVITSVAACADFPPGVHVQVAEDITAEALAAVLSRYLDDASLRTEVEEACVAFSTAWGYSEVADALLQFVERDL
jgi:glycosyltransferase involved in cell wall biosynthesis